MQPVTVIKGQTPVILAMPHAGTYVPDDIFACLNGRGRQLADTDWHIDKLYDGLLSDVTIVKANFSRYVVDANRDPLGTSLYPGQNTTGLCPTISFEGEPLYREGLLPDADEIKARCDQFHAPYHAAIEAEIVRLKKTFDHVVLYDCHSIRQSLPFLFQGILPSLNIGTNDGQSCAIEIEQQANRICASAPFSSVLNGRFKGGWTTRHYGAPHKGIHAFQMEIAQSAYLAAECPPWAFDNAKAEQLRPTLQSLVNMMNEYCVGQSRMEGL